MALEARWAASQPVAIDHRPRIDELERQRPNLIGAIKSGGLAVELTEELKTVTAELARVQTLQTAARPKVPKAPETVERRIERVHERLAEGGELAQGAVSEVCPAGIWLYPDPDCGGSS